MPVAPSLQYDPAAAKRHLRRADPVLGDIMRRSVPFQLRPRATQSLFGALMESIVYQQLSGKAAATIFARFRALYPGNGFPDPARVLATPHALLRGAGLSEAKARAIRDLAHHAEQGLVLPIPALRRMTPDAVVERLTVVRGVGRWTVEMLLLFRVGHPDVLPAHDLGIRKGLARIMRRRELPEPAAVIRRGERWRPWRSVASWYLWRAAELPRARSRSRSR